MWERSTVFLAEEILQVSRAYTQDLCFLVLCGKIKPFVLGCVTTRVPTPGLGYVCVGMFVARMIPSVEARSSSFEKHFDFAAT